MLVASVQSGIVPLAHPGNGSHDTASVRQNRAPSALRTTFVSHAPPQTPMISDLQAEQAGVDVARCATPSTSSSCEQRICRCATGSPHIPRAGALGHLPDPRGLRLSRQVNGLAQTGRRVVGRAHHEMLVVKVLKRAGVGAPEPRRHVDARREARVQTEVVVIVPRRGAYT